MRPNDAGLRTLHGQVVIVLVLLISGPLGAHGQPQRSSAHAPQTRIRLRFGLADSTVVGRFLALRGDSVVVLPEGARQSVAVSRTGLVGIDTSGGKPWGISRGVGVGLAIGMGLGALEALSFNAAARTTCTTYSCGSGRALDAGAERNAKVLAVVSSMLTGAAVGLIAGAIHRGEYWDVVPVAKFLRERSVTESETATGRTLSVAPRGRSVSLGLRWTY